MEQDVGVQDKLIADQAGETIGKSTEWMKEVRRLKIKMRWAEAGRKNQNTQAEQKIGKLKKRWKTEMTQRRVTKTVMGLWFSI
jgi:hypothetical protein